MSKKRVHSRKHSVHSNISKAKKGKGQAAMEFLMTYGWAILAAIITIGVLASFGVFSSSKLASEKVVLSSPFFGKVVVVTNNGSNTAIQMEVLNGGDEEIVVTGLSLKSCGQSALNRPTPSGATQIIGLIC